MLKINGKTFMNLQEAVQWLLDNNALPFQCTANYAPNTEIGLGTIVNPSPAKVRIGSLIFFADSKVSTVTGITENGFIVSDQYNNLVDDVAYVTNVAINASGHLITTMSDGQTIDAGLIKQITSFNINGSQHLLANYNDGTSTDLGAIFSGNITISGDLNVTGTADADTVTGNLIVEKMNGYSFTKTTASGITTDYAGVVKTGNKITFAIAGHVLKDADTPYNPSIGTFEIPSAVTSKIFPIGAGTNVIDVKELVFQNSGDLSETPKKHLVHFSKNAIYPTLLVGQVHAMGGDFTPGATYAFRYEITFLLSENLAS